MKNWKLPAPILCVIVLSLLVKAPLLAQSDSAGSNSVSPLPTVTPSTAVTSSPGPATGAATAPSPARHTIAYTVVKGDSLTSIATKFNTTRKKLKALNGLTIAKVTPGQTLLVPFRKSSSSSSAAKAKAHHEYAMAQPVQDFDIPASTFGSCPVPLPSPEDDADSTAPETTEKPAPVAKLVSPAELDAEIARENREAAETARETIEAPVAQAAPAIAETPVAPTIAANHRTKSMPGYSAEVAGSPPAVHSPATRLTSHGFNPATMFNPFNPFATAPAEDWGNRFLQQARLLGNLGIEYDDDWRPPGEARSWTMDCSNTSRYLYKVTAGIQLPRTASDQYYYLHLQGKAWDVPQTANGWADTEYLRHHLKAGDLLFWENTYRPERQPPITHVMVFLGTNNHGQWIMAGSQSSRGGEHNRRNGGPDVYVFRPAQPCGGYTTWLGLVHHQGRFCAFGRPLEADPSKLAVAVDD